MIDYYARMRRTTSDEAVLEALDWWAQKHMRKDLDMFMSDVAVDYITNATNILQRMERDLDRSQKRAAYGSCRSLASVMWDAVWHGRRRNHA